MCNVLPIRSDFFRKCCPGLKPCIKYLLDPDIIELIEPRKTFSCFSPILKKFLNYNVKIWTDKSELANKL